MRKSASRPWGDSVAMINKIISKKFNKTVFNNFTFQKLVLGLFFFITLSSILFFTSLPQKYDIKVGDVLQENIIARKDAMNTVATNKLRQAAADAVPKKYTLDHTITAEVKHQITETFNYIKEIRARNYLDDSEKIKLLSDKMPDISEDTCTQAITLSDTSLKELETITKAVIETVMEGGIKEDSIERAKTYIIEESET